MSSAKMGNQCLPASAGYQRSSSSDSSNPLQLVIAGILYHLNRRAPR